MRNSVNLGFNFRRGCRIQIPHHPAAPPDRIDQRRKSKIASCNGPEVDLSNSRGEKGIGVKDDRPGAIGWAWGK